MDKDKEDMMTEIDPKNAFVHVVYEYRCLVRAQYAFTECERYTCINDKIQELGTVARNAVLSKARSLVDFYMPKPRKKRRNKADTDITAQRYFGGFLGKDSQILKELDRVRASMEVHDMHLTVWRDPGYQELCKKEEKERQRIDWDKEQAEIVHHLVKALREVAPSLGAQWKEAFAHLYDTCTAALNSGGDWASDLTGPGTIIPYLNGLGL